MNDFVIRDSSKFDYDKKRCSFALNSASLQLLPFERNRRKAAIGNTWEMGHFSRMYSREPHAPMRPTDASSETGGAPAPATSAVAKCGSNSPFPSIVPSNDWYFSLISGQTSGLQAELARSLLKAASYGYGAVVCARNLAYSKHLLSIKRFERPVISVGNITTGGTGKTPITAWLAHFAERNGYKPGIVSRGYRPLANGENDEWRLLKRLCPTVPHVQSPQRVLAIETLIQEFDCNVIIADDAFQHRRLARDCNLLVIDATNPWGFEELLPRGLLREPLIGLQRATIALLTRCDQVTPHELSIIKTQIQKIAPKLPIVSSQFFHSGYVLNDGTVRSHAEFMPPQFFAFCGIGNPSGFLRMAHQLGTIIDYNIFPDHHHYSRDEVRNLVHVARKSGATMLLTTEKDQVKIDDEWLDGFPCLAPRIELKFDDAVGLEQLLRDQLGWAA